MSNQSKGVQNYVYKAKLTQKSIYLPCTIESDTKTITCEALLDTRAMDNYIDIEFAKKHRLHHQSVKPLAVFKWMEQGIKSPQLLTRSCSL